RRPGVAAGGRRRPRHSRPPARSVVVPVAVARGGDRRQHRRRLPALQQKCQRLLLRARSLGARPAMWKLIARNLLTAPVTEPPPPVSREALVELAAKVDKAAQARLGRSLSIRQIDAGSCNGCELEIHALNNPFYDIERFGIRFVASPRHADV